MFEPATAALFTEKAHEKRRENKARVQELLDRASILSVTPSMDLERLRRYLDRVDRLIEATEDPVELETLARAHSKWFSAYLKLTGQDKKAKVIVTPPALDLPPIDPPASGPPHKP